MNPKAILKKNLISSCYLGKFSIHGVGVGKPDGQTIRIYHASTLPKKIKDEILEDSAPFSVIFEQDAPAQITED